MIGKIILMCTIDYKVNELASILANLQEYFRGQKKLNIYFFWNSADERHDAGRRPATWCEAPREAHELRVAKRMCGARKQLEVWGGL